MHRDYTAVGLFGSLLIFGGIVLLAQTGGVAATALSVAVIAAGALIFVVCWRLQTRPFWRRARARRLRRAAQLCRSAGDGAGGTRVHAAARR